MNQDKMNKHQCEYCGWYAELPNSHVAQAAMNGCEVIEERYDVFIDDEGEVDFREKEDTPPEWLTALQPSIADDKSNLNWLYFHRPHIPWWKIIKFIGYCDTNTGRRVLTSANDVTFYSRMVIHNAFS